MAEVRIVTTSNGTVLGICSWTEGFIPLKPPKKFWRLPVVRPVATRKEQAQKYCKNNIFSSKKRRD